MRYRVFVNKKLVMESERRFDLVSLKVYFDRYEFSGANASTEHYDYLFKSGISAGHDPHNSPFGYGWGV